jgi:hypothetical protein
MTSSAAHSSSSSSSSVAVIVVWWRPLVLPRRPRVAPASIYCRLTARASCSVRESRLIVHRGQSFFLKMAVKKNPPIVVVVVLLERYPASNATDQNACIVTAASFGRERNDGSGGTFFLILIFRAWAHKMVVVPRRLAGREDGPRLFALVVVFAAAALTLSSSPRLDDDDGVVVVLGGFSFGRFENWGSYRTTFPLGPSRRAGVTAKPASKNNANLPHQFPNKHQHG